MWLQSLMQKSTWLYQYPSNVHPPDVQSNPVLSLLLTQSCRLCSPMTQSSVKGSRDEPSWWQMVGVGLRYLTSSHLSPVFAWFANKNPYAHTRITCIGFFDSVLWKKVWHKSIILSPSQVGGNAAGGTQTNSQAEVIVYHLCADSRALKGISFMSSAGTFP